MGPPAGACLCGPVEPPLEFGGTWLRGHCTSAQTGPQPQPTHRGIRHGHSHLPTLGWGQVIQVGGNTWVCCAVTTTQCVGARACAYVGCVCMPMGCGMGGWGKAWQAKAQAMCVCMCVWLRWLGGVCTCPCHAMCACPGATPLPCTRGVHLHGVEGGWGGVGWARHGKARHGMTSHGIHVCVAQVGVCGSMTAMVASNTAASVAQVGHHCGMAVLHVLHCLRQDNTPRHA